MCASRKKRSIFLSLVLATLLASIFASSAFAASAHVTSTAQTQASGSCSPSVVSVTLYKGLNKHGASICFGVGSVNLKDYPGWDNQARSWSNNGCPLGDAIANIEFSTKPNGGGQLQQVFATPTIGTWGNFTGKNGTLPPRTLSYVNVGVCSTIG